MCVCARDRRARRGGERAHAVRMRVQRRLAVSRVQKPVRVQRRDATAAPDVWPSAASVRRYRRETIKEQKTSKPINI